MIREPIEFVFDVVCPYAYLASLEIEDVAARAGVPLEWRPILLGGVFRAIGGPDQPAGPPSKQAYRLVDIARSAERAGAQVNFPPNHPRRTVLAMRTILASGDVPRAARALFAAYWREGRDVSDPVVVASALSEAGFDGEELVRRAENADVKEALRNATDRAVADGVFGVPTTIVREGGDAELYWGWDRLDLVRRRAETPLPSRPRTGPSSPRVEVYFDYSSPYAYLAVMQLRPIAERTGAEIVLRPIVLGGLFKAIGTPDVPVFAMPPPKQRHQSVELERWARLAGVPFRFASRFPTNTVKALRLTLVAPEPTRLELAERIGRAMWAEDRDISSLEELHAIAGDLVPPEAFSAIESDEVKTRLRDATTAAQTRGVFGVPTFDVGGDLYWGQDRVAWVEERLVRAE